MIFLELLDEGGPDRYEPSLGPNSNRMIFVGEHLGLSSEHREKINDPKFLFLATLLTIGMTPAFTSLLLMPQRVW